MTVELVQTKQPHFIPGYTGYCPQFKYRTGDTYGHTTHKLLLDTGVSHSEKLVLSDRSVDDYQVFRPPARDIDIVDARARYGDAIFTHPMLPGYEGFVPRERGRFGHAYTVQATEAMAEFERQQMEERAKTNQIIQMGRLQDGKYEPINLQEKEQIKTKIKLPLCEVRPEMTGIVRNIQFDEPPLSPPKQSKSPYFIDTSSTEKYTKAGFSGHVPFGYSAFGHSNLAMTNSILCDFTSNYRRRQSTEWAPITITKPDPPLLIQPTQIYHKHLGQIPNYAGHIPGAVFRYGKTFVTDTRDAKRWLRGDFSL